MFFTIVERRLSDNCVTPADFIVYHGVSDPDECVEGYGTDSTLVVKYRAAGTYLAGFVALTREKADFFLPKVKKAFLERNAPAWLEKENYSIETMELSIAVKMDEERRLANS